MDAPSPLKEKKSRKNTQGCKCQIFSVNVNLDYVITVGGDGTILYTAKELKYVTPPFLSFQKGTLGFLCKFTTEEIDSVIEKAVIAKGMKEEDIEFPF